MGKSITLTQKKAIAGLAFLHQSSRAAGFRRWDIGQAIKKDCSSFQVSTMRALQRAGFVKPVCDIALELVETGQCSCGCDLWTATDAGMKYAESLNVVRVHGEGGKLPAYAGPVTEKEKEQLRRENQKKIARLRWLSEHGTEDGFEQWWQENHGESDA